MDLSNIIHNPNDEIARVTPEVIEIVKMRHDVLRLRRLGA
jgi:hypothetical protein